jgi:solute carrier family 27 fatty acid transporter 1/4
MFQVGQYIGEMCRYLMAVPRKPEDSSHHVRIMVGNGMRPAIWKDFIERFKVQQMTELYGSTEGNVNISKLFCSENYNCFYFSTYF